MKVELRPITRDTVRAVCKLDAGDGSRRVASNAVSIAQAYFYDEAWFRAIYCDDELVGFVMLNDPTLAPSPAENEFYLWRLMVDKAHHGKGIGRAAVEKLVEHVRARPGAQRLLVSHVKDAEPLSRFYSGLGFEYTGDEEDGELIMMRAL